MSKQYNIKLSTMDNVPKFDEYKYRDDSKDMVGFLNENKEKLEFYSSLKRGDVVCLEEYHEYTNEGQFIYDGSKFLELEYEYEEYGYVPKSFITIEEFPLFYWDDTDIANKRIFHIKGCHLNSLKYESSEKEDKYSYIYTFSFNYMNKKYSIVLDSRKNNLKPFSPEEVITLAECDYGPYDFVVLRDEY